MTDEKVTTLRPPTAPELICLADVEPKPINWLWKEKMALGKVSLIAGDPGLGKSLLTIAMAAVVSKGGAWPVDRTQAPKGSVILMSAEDDLADTIRPRLDAAGADVSKIHSLTMIRYIDESLEQAQRFFSLKLDLPRLEGYLESLNDCRLVVIDPVSAFTGGTDTHNNADVRGLLAPLSDLAQRHQAAIVCVTHLNKGSGQAMYRTMGSLAFVAAARAVLAVAKDKEDPLRRLVMPVKNNLGNDLSGLAYKIGKALNGAPVVEWEPEAIYETIDQVLGQDAECNALDEAKDWLKIVLTGGPKETKEIKSLAQMAGHAWATVRRAKEELRAKAIKGEFQGGWAWKLPDPNVDYPPKVLKEPQDAHSNTVSALGSDERLREFEDEYQGLVKDQGNGTVKGSI